MIHFIRRSLLRAAVPKPRVRTNEADMGRASDESAMNNPEERQLKIKLVGCSPGSGT